MSDVPESTPPPAAAPTPSPGAVPTPGPTPAAVASEATPAPAGGQASGFDEPLTRDMGIILDDAAGNPVNVTMGDLADAYRGQLKPEEKEELSLYQKVFKEGDPAAIQQFVSQHLPAPAAELKTPEQEQIETLTQTVGELKNQLSSLSPVVNKITDQAGIAQLTQVIETNKEKLPCCSKVPNAASLVSSKEREILSLVQERGLLQGQNEATQRQILNQVRIKAFALVEKNLAEYASIFSPSTPEAAPPPSGTTVVDDQRTGKPSDPGYHPAPYQMVNGQWVDTRTQAAASAPAPVPATPVTDIPTGGSPGVVEEAPANQRMTVQSMRDNMKAKISNVGNVL